MRCSLFLIVGLLCCWGATPAMAQPANDDCLGAIPITEGTGFTYDTVGATVSAPGFSCGATAPDVWVEYTASCTGLATIATTFFSAGNDSVIHVYDACGGAVLACDDDAGVGFLSIVDFNTVSGASYLVRLSGWSGSTGNGTYDVSCLAGSPEDCSDGIDNDLDGAIDCGDPDCSGIPPCPAAGAGDECLSALPAAVGLNPYDTALMLDSAEPFSCVGGSFPGQMSKDMWWEFTASSTAVHRAENCSTTHDSDMEVYEGVCGALVQLDCSGDSCGLRSQVEWNAIAGTTYIIRLGSWAQGASGSGNMTVIEGGVEDCFDLVDNDFDGLVDCADTADCIPGVAPCIEDCADGIDNDADLQVDCADPDCFGEPICAAAGNDFCSGALPILCGDTVFGDTTTATADVQPTCGTTNGTAGGVWFSLIGTGDQVTLTTCNVGTSYDTKIRVWEGTCAGLVCVTGNDDAACGIAGLRSTVSWLSVSGIEYLILVHGFAGTAGTFEMTVSCLTPGVEDCTDGLDNDLDGLIDCADTVDCIPGVAPCIEDCADGIDNDADGLTDCADADCLGDPACAAAVNDLCTGALPVLCGDTVLGNTITATVDVQPTCGTTSGTAGGVWYSFMGNGDQVTLTTCNAGSNFDTKIRVWEGNCAGLVCVTGNDDSACAFSGLRSRVSWLSVAGIEYFILVHGFGGAAGNFEMTVSCVTPGVEDCSDGVDNDLDGLIDCADTVDCISGVAPCIEDCFDLIDNDADGLLDCLDPDCAGEPACQEICNDGIDNDTDGFVDCFDGECACTAFCAAPLLGDECCNALPAITGANAFSTVGLTTSSDPHNPAQCAGTAFGTSDNDVWLSWTAAITGDAIWDTCAAGSFDTDVTIYEGSDCGTKVQIACNGDGVGLAGCQIFYSAGLFPVSAGTTYLFRIGGFGAATVGTGTLTIAETCSAAVTSLAGSADCISGNVSLGWDPAGFSGYDIARNGTVIASLPAGATAYTDLAVANGTYTYDVIGVCGGGGGATSSVDVTVASYGGEQDLVLRGELAAGLTDSVAALTAELTSLGRSFVIVDGGIGDYPCNTAPFEIIWNMNGTFAMHRCLTAADGAALESAHLAGAGIYTECGDQWGFCAPGSSGAFETFDGVAPGALDGNDGFLGMDGFDSGLGLDLSSNANIPYTQDQAGNDWTDQLTVAAADPGLSAVAAIWALDDALGAPYNTGVYGTGIASTGNVISQSWEFGGYGGDKNALAAAYVGALGGGVVVLEQFKRGDCNIDGFLNIADAIFGLGALFPPGGGTPNDPQCDDSCDANDDGFINIADMITILGNLFPPGGGSPTVIPAPFNVCGADPTSDGLNCASYPTCP